jgi:hypothetical protein
MRAPQPVDQGVAQHDLVSVDQQIREQRPLLADGQRNGSAVPRHLDGAKHTNVHEPTSWWIRLLAIAAPGKPTVWRGRLRTAAGRRRVVLADLCGDQELTGGGTRRRSFSALGRQEAQ